MRATNPTADADSTPFVLPFDQLGAEDLPRVGGKGANLGEMTRAGLPVPPGFCVTTEAFRRFVDQDPEIETAVYGKLDELAPGDVAGARDVGEAIRARLLSLPVPEAVESAVVDAWRTMGAEHAYAVRSSATAEDLPGASFAGQQDTFLNVRGRDAMVDALRRAWVSLFTDRAILYRARNGFGHRDVALSAVVQRMVVPEVSGILFTADPLTGHRHVASIDAGFGLGEALVSGIVSADLYRVDTRTDTILERRIADKALAVRPLPEGGTETVELSPEERTRPSLTDAQALALAAFGRKIEAHYGAPQDIEWVIDVSGRISIVQSRPVTSLFPVPVSRAASSSKGLHVYGSFGHAQVMTDPISPMGRSLLQVVIPFGKDGGPAAENPWMVEAGGRLYVDVTPLLHVAPTRHLIVRGLSMADPLIAAALREVATRPEFDAGPRPVPAPSVIAGMLHWLGPVVLGIQRRLWISDPGSGMRIVNTVCDALVERARARMAAAEPGAERIHAGRLALGMALPELLSVMPPVMGAGYAARLLLGKLAGERAREGDLDAIVRGLSGNVTTEMDLAVGDLADAARRAPEVAARLAAGDPETAIAYIERSAGSEEFLVAWNNFLESYGMRGPSEIDVGRPRWSEAPGSLVAMVAGSMRGEPGAHRAHQRRMAEEGEAAGERLIAASAHGLFAPLRARLARRFVLLIRNGMPVREHPKFALIRVMGLLKAALLEAGESLAAEGRLADSADVFQLRLDELIEGLGFQVQGDQLIDESDLKLRREEMVDSLESRLRHDKSIEGHEAPAVDLAAIVAERRKAETRFAEMRPPRVSTSDGEIPEVRHAVKDMPPGALAGASASSGVVEGVARVVLDPMTTVLSPGEILVAPFTDPGWTPLFISAAALVMEVGGLMTHGSVVAREYGIPAVVGVLEATARIKTGQRLRVDGNRGFVEILGADDVEEKSAHAIDSTAVPNPGSP